MEPYEARKPWGVRACRRCNAAGVRSRPSEYLPYCPDCDGSGWGDWPALAITAKTEIIPDRLWVGSHDFNCAVNSRTQEIASAGEPSADDFDVVVSMYTNGECVPHEDIEHHEFLFNDGELDMEAADSAITAAMIVASRVEDGQRVLVRCRAGLNRAGLVSALAMMYLNYRAEDAIQLLRALRSPWMLCNQAYVDWLMEHDREPLTP